MYKTQMMREKLEELKEKSKKVMSELWDELEKQGHKVNEQSYTREIDNIVFVDSHYINVDIYSEFSGTPGFRKPTGKLRMKFYNGDKYKNYPEPKKGFDIKKQVTRIKESIKNIEYYKKLDEIRHEESDKSKAYFRDTCNELGIKYDKFLSSVYRDGINISRHGLDSVRIQADVTTEELRKILDILGRGI